MDERPNHDRDERTQGADVETGEEATDDELRDEPGFLAPGVPPWYEGSPGAALATESEEDIPEPNEPA